MFSVNTGVFADTVVLFIFISGIILIMSGSLRPLSAGNGRTGLLGRYGGRVHNLSHELRSSRRMKKRRAVMEKEIYSSAALLSNIAIIQSQAPKGAIYIIEQMASYSDHLKQPFEHMLYYLRQNRTEEALDAFEREAGTGIAREYGAILLQMDKIRPSEQKENIRLLMQKLREENITREKTRNETISDLIYIPVLANVIVVFINFIYIAFYAEQKDLFMQLFNL